MSALTKRLQMKPGTSWLIYQMPDHYLSLLEPLPKRTTISHTPQGDFNGIQIFLKNKADLTQNFDAVIKPLLKPGTLLWIIYPKKGSTLSSDLNMMSDWHELTQHGLRPVASAAVDETWSAMRFRPLGQAKESATSNSNIKDTEYAQYIDVLKKKITLPEDVENALNQHPAALDKYQSLAYSHKKEYVVWILTAKQEKTRTDRINKMVEKLLAGKKNPAEK